MKGNLLVESNVVLCIIVTFLHVTSLMGNSKNQQRKVGLSKLGLAKNYQWLLWMKLFCKEEKRKRKGRQQGQTHPWVVPLRTTQRMVKEPKMTNSFFWTFKKNVFTTRFFPPCWSIAWFNIQLEVYFVIEKWKLLEIYILNNDGLFRIHIH